MKLRLRSLESNKTLKVDVPDSSTLHQLKQLLYTSTAVYSTFFLHLSLNGKDELLSRNPDDALQSLGLRSGDIVYHTQNPEAFVNPDPKQHWGVWELNQDSRGQDPVAMDSENTTNLGVSSDERLNSDMTNSFPEEQRLDSSTSKNEGGPGYSNSVSHRIDFDGDARFDLSVLVHNKYSEHYFLRVEGGHRHRALVNAVHEVMLASGLVGINPVTGMLADRFCLSEQWPFKASTLSLQYSLAGVITGGGNKPKTVVLRFQSWGHFITVCGSLAKGNSRFCCVTLDEHRFGPVIVTNRKNAKKKETVGSSCSYAENKVCAFSKLVKDRLALPLLIDLTEGVGLPLPPCFMCLPAELKLKIFESLTGVDLANVGRVSKELRYLASNNDLWKRKYADEFGEPVDSQGCINWKQRFAGSWEAKKKKNRSDSSLRQRIRRALLSFQMYVPEPEFLVNPGPNRRAPPSSAEVFDMYMLDPFPVLASDTYCSPDTPIQVEPLLRVSPCRRVLRGADLDSGEVFVPRVPKNGSHWRNDVVPRVPKNFFFWRKGKHH